MGQEALRRRVIVENRPNGLRFSWQLSRRYGMVAESEAIRPRRKDDMNHEITGYTAKWDGNQAQALEAGDTVETCEQCDDREWDAFMRALKRAGLSLRWLSFDGDTLLDRYDVIEAPDSAAAGRIL